MNIDKLSAKIRSAGKQHCVPRWEIDARRTRQWDYLDLWMLVDGKGVVQTPDGRMNLEPGALLVMRGGEDYYIHPNDDNQPFVHYWAHFDYYSPDEKKLDHRALNLPPHFRQLGSTRFVNEMFDRLLEAMQPPNPDKYCASRWLMAILSEIAQVDREKEKLNLNFPHCEKLDELRERILKNPGGNHSVRQMAKEVHIVPSYFCRLFTKRFGMSPRKFVTFARMDTARHLLQDTPSSIGEIADILGYEDIYFFSRHFRRQHGISPSEYRKGEPCATLSIYQPNSPDLSVAPA